MNWKNINSKSVAIGKAMLMGIGRDPTLVMLCFAPFIIIPIFAIVPMVLEGFLHTRFGFSLVPFYPHLVAFVLLLVPLLYGMLMGFLFLDDRDENILSYIGITPIGKRGYLLLRLGLLTVAVILINGVLLFLTQLLVLPLWLALTLAILTSLEMPLATLFLASFAANKVEALALGKFYGMILLPVLIPLLVDSPFRYFAGFISTFWVGEIVLSFTRQGTGLLLPIVAGFLTHLLALAFLARHFTRRMD